MTLAHCEKLLRKKGVYFRSDLEAGDPVRRLLRMVDGGMRAEEGGHVEPGGRERVQVGSGTTFQGCDL